MCLGIWLMISPAVLQYEGFPKMMGHLAGPLVITAAIVAMAEPLRMVRWTNAALGACLIAAPLILSYPVWLGVHSVVIGVLVAVGACIEGPLYDRIGGGWTVLWRGSPERDPHA